MSARGFSRRNLDWKFSKKGDWRIIYMKYFQTYTSNTCAGSGNQLVFGTGGQEHVGRIYYKIRTGGTYRYSFLFSNLMDSTFADGAVSHKNLICDQWTITGARVGTCAKESESMLDVNRDISCRELNVNGWKQLLFGGETEKEVMPGAFFATDPVMLTFEKEEYLCLEIRYQGEMIPYHEESLLPAFVWNGEQWEYSKQVPFPGMIGCDRPVKRRIAYLGDSITQGIGTEKNSYEHWNALVSEWLGDEYACWNLGLGFGRANDAASDGAWLFKAKQNDVIVICYGVNDLLQGMSEQQIADDLTVLAKTLKGLGRTVLLQTIPPFEYQGETREIWKRLNEYIKTELAKLVDCVFDVVPVLQVDEEHSHQAKYGAHPNAEGCRKWAEALYPVMKQMLEETEI